MPPLPVLGTFRSKRELRHVLGMAAPSEPKGRRVVDGLVRLSDKAVLEYQGCRDSLLHFLRHGDPDKLHRAQDHFESSIQSLHRAINYLERLRNLGYVRPGGEPLVARPRDMEILRDAVRTKIRTFRGFIEHLERDIIQDKVLADKPAFLHLGWDHASINSATLEYGDVARWCSQLHYFALPLSVVTITVRSPADGTAATSGA